VRSLAHCLVLLAFTANLAAQLPEAWRHWRYSARIGTAPTSIGRLVSVPVPARVTTRARRDWIDLRVIDSRGGEVPFMLHARLGGKSFNRRQVPLLEPSAVEGRYQQAVADTGSGGVVHNSVKLGFETNQNLLSWVEIAVSGDLKDWRVVRERAPIYVLRAEGMGENTDVSYPDSASRFVRIRILDGSGKYRLRSAELGYQTAAIAERVPSGVALAASTNRSGQSVWTSDADASAFPVSRVEFQTTQTSFYRFATVESSDDGERWRPVTGGDILRQPDSSGERAWLILDFPEEHARRWRIAVNNRNDAPVADLRPILLTAPRRIVLRQDSGESYRLLYGNPRAQAPRYDMVHLTDAKMLETAEPATLGAEAVNPAWVDPSPWTERYDAVLWVALVLAVVMLGVVAVRTLRSSGA
jgi:hypothetical protein